jgi:hypothetical protein
VDELVRAFALLKEEAQRPLLTFDQGACGRTADRADRQLDHDQIYRQSSEIDSDR